MFASAMTLQFVLDSTTTLVEFQVRQLHHMKRIGHLDRLGHGLVKDAAVGTREIEGGVTHVAEPVFSARQQPGRRRGPTATGHHVEELSALDVHDLSRVVLAAILALAHEEHFVEAQRSDDADAVLVIDQGLAVGEEGVVNGVPVTAQFLRHLSHAASAATHLLGDPASRAVAQTESARCDQRILFGPRAVWTRGLGTAETSLVPHQSSRSSEGGQVHQFDPAPVLHVRDDPADRTAGECLNPFDVHPQWFVVATHDTEHGDGGQTHQKFAHANRVGFHESSPVRWR